MGAMTARADLPDIGMGDSTAPWQISADRITFDEVEQVYVAEGHVSVTREGRVLTAERIVFNDKARTAEADGDVRLVSNQDQLWGRKLVLDLDTETGTLSDGTLFIAQNHLYLSGGEISKTGPQSYSVSQATVTSCDGPDPDWRITGREVEVTIEGYGSAQHAAFWVKQLPILYSPYLFFPVKLKRQTGLLEPALGYSQRKGYEYLQPFFWAIDDSSDATIFAHEMTRRGLRGGAEYRYVQSPESMGTLMADGLIDRETDDGSPENTDEWGYGGDAYARPNQDRYWLRAKADQELPAAFTAKLDLDVVSDQDYLHEFRSLPGGFDQTRNYFRDTYGRDIDDYNDPIRLNRLNISRFWSFNALNADVRWYDDVRKRRWEENNDTLQQLPIVTFDGIRRPLGPTPFYYGYASSYVNYHREDGTRGQRMDLYPRLYYPFYVLGGVTVQPSAGWRHTAWHIDHYDPESPEDRRDFYRSIYDLRLDLHTEFYRVFAMDTDGYDRLKHAIVPEIRYDYIPNEVQTDWPRFDSLDRIRPKNAITYGLINYLTSRRNIPAQENRPPTFDYLNFLRLEVSQSFDINCYNENHDEPFSDISAELDFVPGRWIGFRGESAWSPYDEQFSRHALGIRLWDNRGDKFSAEYHYRRSITSDENDRAQEALESILLEAHLVLDAQWALRGEHEFNHVTQEPVATMAGINFRRQCWQVDVAYREEPGDRGFIVMFTLNGLGSFGRN
jgi:LPS-assembly protein